MIFTSFEFVLFFIVVLVIRHFITKFSAEKWFLLIASYAFYMSWNIPCVLLIVFTSFVDFIIGLQLVGVKKKVKRRKPRYLKAKVICHKPKIYDAPGINGGIALVIDSVNLIREEYLSED